LSVNTKEPWRKYPQQTSRNNKINAVEEAKSESKVSQKLFAYSSKEPLEVIKQVRTTIKVSDREEIVDRFVVIGNNQSLLGSRVRNVSNVRIFKN